MITTLLKRHLDAKQGCREAVSTGFHILDTLLQHCHDEMDGVYSRWPVGFDDDGETYPQDVELAKEVIRDRDQLLDFLESLRKLRRDADDLFAGDTSFISLD